MKFLFILCVFVGLGANMAYSAAAAASHLERLHMEDRTYSFALFLKSPEGRKALEELKGTGLFFINPQGHSVFLHSYPASFEANEAFRASETGQKLFRPSLEGYHDYGHLWPREKLAKIFLGVSAAGIIEKYVKERNYFPPTEVTVWSSVPAFNSLQDALNLPFKVEEGQIISMAVGAWWEAYKQKPVGASANRSRVFLRKIQEVLNLGIVSGRGAAFLREQLRQQFKEAILREISGNDLLVDLGVLYQRLKVIEEKNKHNKELTDFLDTVQDVTSYWVDQTFKYAVFHIMLGQPVEKAASDAEIELLQTLPPSLHPRLLLREAQKFIKA